MLNAKFDPKQIRLYRPPADSHKGQNGRLLVIGGSKLFHTSIFWSADVASRIVDLVHFSSPANENNEVVRKRIKEGFWTGIVVDWAEVEEYIQEDDCILIGPGMGRSDDTATIINTLLKKYPNKRWVIDGGALQMVESGLITECCILTPHRGEFERLWSKMDTKGNNTEKLNEKVSIASKTLKKSTILLKGKVDIVCQGEKCTQVKGGNPGMTKGGTGDVLAGIVAALYCLAERDPALQDKNDTQRRMEGAWRAATTGSFVNKKAGDRLHRRVGLYFNASDLGEEAPKVLAELFKMQ